MDAEDWPKGGTATLKIPNPSNARQLGSDGDEPANTPEIVDIVDLDAQVVTRAMLEERIAERTRELTTLLEVARAIGSTLELDPLLQLICEQVCTVTGGYSAGIMFYEDGALTVGASGLAPGDVGQHLTVPPGSAHDEALKQRRAVTIPDIRGDTPQARIHRELVGERLETSLRDIRSWMLVPLLVKDEVIGLIGVSHQQPAFFTAHHAELASAIATQAAMAIENARLHEHVRRHSAIEERQRLARELHDSVSQAFYGIGLGAQSALVWLERDPAKVLEPLQYVVELASAGLAEMRALIFDLRPEALEQEGLVRGLERQASALAARHRLAVETAFGEEPDIALDTKEALYRIAQEALHNVVKHARATHVRVCLAQHADSIALEIHDDGIGFDAQGNFPGHLGLRSMRERVTRLGGEVELTSVLGQGTTVCVRVPLPA
jgi:signal transduction histidine kinase